MSFRWWENFLFQPKKICYMFKAYEMERNKQSLIYINSVSSPKIDLYLFKNSSSKSCITMSAIMGDAERPSGRTLIYWKNALLHWKYSEFIRILKRFENSSVGKLVCLWIFFFFLILFVTNLKWVLGNKEITSKEAMMWYGDVFNFFFEV